MDIETASVVVVNIDVVPPKAPAASAVNASAKAAEPPHDAAEAKEPPKKKKKRDKTYLQLVVDAVAALNAKSGSSQPAIIKYLTQHDDNDVQDTPHFRRNLNAALRKGSKEGVLVKVKNSYKLPGDSDVPVESTAPMSELQQQVRSLLEANKMDALIKLSKSLARKEWLTAVARERARLLGQRRRKSTMDDVILHQQDALFNIKHPLPPRPTLPVLDKKYNMDAVADAFVLYHFFCGDVSHRANDDVYLPLVPTFTLQQLMEDASTFNAPLISHLACTCLQLLLQAPDKQAYAASHEYSLRLELHQALLPVLSSTTWPEVCSLYMDALDRYSRSPHTIAVHDDPNVLPSRPIDAAYLLGRTDTPSALKSHADSLPPGYHGYLGAPGETLYRAQAKLGRGEIWTLGVDEVLKLVRTLADDVIAYDGDYKFREAQFHQLASARRAAEGALRKAKRNTTTLERTLENCIREYDQYDFTVRTLPLGRDRHDNGVYTINDLLLLEDRHKSKKWHIIDNVDAYSSSLDVRGTREAALFQALQPDQAAPPSERDLERQVHDQKVAELQTKLQARSQNVMRTSHRLADQFAFETQRLQNELDNLLQVEWSDDETDAVPLPSSPTTKDTLSLLQHFERTSHLAGRRTREVSVTRTRLLPLMECSKLCTTGIVTLLTQEWMQVFELCQDLWRDSNLEQCQTAVTQAVQVWEDNTRGKPMNPFLSTNVVQVLKPPLLQLEERTACITHLIVANQDVDLADDNISVNTNVPSGTEPPELPWKRCVYQVRGTASKRAASIRDTLASAISCARKAHLPEVVSKLRAALLLYRPGAAGEAKTAALKVLADHGGYDPEEDEFMGKKENATSTTEDTKLPSMISQEAEVLKEDTPRSEWRASVEQAKTLRRLAILLIAFCRHAATKLSQLVDQRDALKQALDVWHKDLERKSRKNLNKYKATEEFQAPSEVWAPVDFLPSICMAQVQKFPWWPARKCVLQNTDDQAVLEQANYCLVSLVGEMGALRLVHINHIQDFAGDAIRVVGERIRPNMRSQLDDCLAMARRLQRAYDKEGDKTDNK